MTRQHRRNTIAALFCCCTALSICAPNSAWAANYTVNGFNFFIPDAVLADSRPIRAIEYQWWNLPADAAKTQWNAWLVSERVGQCINSIAYPAGGSPLSAFTSIYDQLAAAAFSARGSDQPSGTEEHRLYS